MIPNQPVPVMGTDPNLTGQGMMIQPMQGMMGAPGMMGYAQNFVYVQDPMKELASSNGAIIRQQVEMFEAISGCETQNRYHVFLQTPMGLKAAFKCYEKSGCCSRCCCSNDCRGLKLDINHIASPSEFVSDISKLYIKAEKPCALGCLCCCRPHMDIYLHDNHQYIGRVREPFTCCDRDAEVYGSDNNLRYRLVGSCCQYGFCCGAAAEKMVEIEFAIERGGEQVGMMKKMNAMGFGEFFTKADSYKITFPADATAEEKMLLICAGLLIDYQNFEKKERPEEVKREMGMGMY